MLFFSFIYMCEKIKCIHCFLAKMSLEMFLSLTETHFLSTLKRLVPLQLSDSFRLFNSKLHISYLESFPLCFLSCLGSCPLSSPWILTFRSSLLLVSLSKCPDRRRASLPSSYLHTKKWLFFFFQTSFFCILTTSFQTEAENLGECEAEMN